MPQEGSDDDAAEGAGSGGRRQAAKAVQLHSFLDPAKGTHYVHLPTLLFRVSLIHLPPCMHSCSACPLDKREIAASVKAAWLGLSVMAD